jgi:hypothetical protein
MPRSATTGVFARVSNSFSNPVFGTLIDPTDADALFDDQDVGLNPPILAGPLTVTAPVTIGVAGTTAGTAIFLNATSGSITLTPPTGALGTRTLTLPVATDTLVGKATTDTLTNKTFDTAGTGNSFSINGVAATANTGTGAVARADGPTFTVPILGVATATSYNKVTITAPATSATLTLIDGTVLTGPAATDTLVGRASTDTFTGVKTFGSAGAVGRLKVAGTTSGSTILDATAIASGTLTLPAATDTLVGKATTDVLTNKTFDSAGTGNVLQISGVTVSRGQIPGVSTNTVATAGNIGEGISSTILFASAVGLSTGTPANITSISLTAGEWDVTADYDFTGNAATTVTNLIGSISTTSATLNATAGNYTVENFTSFTAFSANNTFVLKGGPVRMSLSGTTTVYAVAQAAFATNTCSVYGQIRATRVH